jgi:plastocyanin
MARRLALPVLVPLVMLLLAWSAAPLAVRAGDPCFHSTDRPPVTDAAETAVTIGDCSFFPTIARVPVGATVTFTNGSVMDHEVAGANLTWGAAQTPIAPGDSVEHTFTAAGVYPYSCMIHPGMTGAIVVGDGGAATAGVLAPAGGDAPSAAADGSPAPAVAEAGASSPEATLPIVLGLVVAGLLVVALVVVALVAGRHRREAATS